MCLTLCVSASSGSSANPKPGKLIGMARRRAQLLHGVHRDVTAAFGRIAGCVASRRGLVTASALLLSLIVLSDVSQAGRQYVFCVSMNQVMQHECCAHALVRATPGPVLASSGRDCCEIRTIPSLASGKLETQRTALFAPAVAVVPHWLRRQAVPSLGLLLNDSDPAMRTGPPPSRALTRLMVFLI